MLATSPAMQRDQATGKRERDATQPPRSTRPTSRPPRQTADATQAIIAQLFKGECRHNTHVHDFESICEILRVFKSFSNSAICPGLGRLTLVICVIMARDSAPPPLPKPRGGLIFQGFSAAVSFSPSFTLHLCPFQLSPYPLLKNQNQDFKRLSLSNCCIYHTMACSIIIWLKYR